MSDDIMTVSWVYPVTPVWLQLNQRGELANYHPDDRPYVLTLYATAVGTARSFGYMGA